MQSEAGHRLIEATRNGEIAVFDGEAIPALLIRRLMLGLPLESGAPVPTPCGVRLSGARIIGKLDLNNGRGVQGEAMPGLLIDSCVCADGIDISYAQIGKISMERTRLNEFKALRAVILGELIANDIGPASSEGYCHLNLHSLYLEGDLQVRRARLKDWPDRDQFGAEQYALDLRNATINGNVYLRHVICYGMINMASATINGDVSAHSAVITPRPDQETAIWGEGAMITGALMLRKSQRDDRFFAYGRVDFTRAKLGAALFDGATLSPQKHSVEAALDLANCEINGGLYFREGFHLDGKADLHSVHVKTDLIAVGGYFRDGVDATGLAVGGELDLAEAATDGALLNLQDAVARRILKVGGVKADINLSRARTTTFDDLGAYDGSRRIYLDGFTYERLEVPGEVRNRGRRAQAWKMRMNWLAAQGDGYHARSGRTLGEWITGAPALKIDRVAYRPQPFVQLGKVLTAMGLEADARQVFKAKQWIEMRHEPWYFRLPLSLFGTFFGFGHSSARAMATLLLYFLIGWGGFAAAQAGGWLVYNTQEVSAFLAWDGTPAMLATPGATPGEPRCDDVDAAYYAVDLMVPLIDLHLEDKCQIRAGPETAPWRIDLPLSALNEPARQAGLSIEIPDHQIVVGHTASEGWKLFHALYAIFGWLTVSLGILTFSGILRRQDI